MQKPVDVLVTGFIQSPELLARSLAPLCRLKQEGIIRHIHCVTWDSAELDGYAAAAASFSEVRLTRVSQPQASGNGHQRGIVYQVENLKAALALVPDDALILKWRPDIVARYDFLRDKITGFDLWSAVGESACFGIVMPPHLFQHKLWIPWADSNSPFFFEDAVFLGTRQEVSRLAVAPTPEDLAILGDAACCSYVHAGRYGKLFVSRYPLLKNYLKRFHLFPLDYDHRTKFVPYLVGNGFGWHLLIAHAWILHSQFHVDIGAPDDLNFYSNAVNPDADWSRPETLKVAFPYRNSTGWREGTKAGMAMPSVDRAFGRLMDDSWQNALFTTGVPDLPRNMLAALMENIARCRDGRLADQEAEFYRNAERIYRSWRPTALAS